MERDTDTDWRKLGDSEPFWGVLTQERYRQDRIDETAKREFYGTGTDDIAFVLSRIAHGVDDFRPREALDFGCGVGRLTLAMARHADAVTGIDISSGMLAEGRRSADTFEIGNAAFLGSIPATARYDWINSYIVFQHIPPRRGYVLLSEILSQLVEGGVCSIQICVLRDQNTAPEFVGYSTFWAFDGEMARVGLDDDPRADGTVRMYDYDLNRVFAIMLTHGIELFGIAPENHGGHHGVWLFGQRKKAAASSLEQAGEYPPEQQDTNKEMQQDTLRDAQHPVQASPVSAPVAESS